MTYNQFQLLAMNKFHHIPTDQFVPISHDNSYLFNHYNKVANFLAFNLENNYKSILAKPVQNGYTIEWFSVFNDLKEITEYEKDLSEKALSQYWDFSGVINAKIDELQNSNSENNKNWAGLLKKVFHHNDNFIFFNGSNICIVWGWKFENTENYVPSFLKPRTPGSEPEAEGFIERPPEVEDLNKEASTEFEEENVEEPNVLEEDEQEDPPVYEEEEIIVDERREEEIEDKEGFLKFLKWFASKYWWSLILLITLIMVVLAIKTINLNQGNTAILSHIDHAGILINKLEIL